MKKHQLLGLAIGLTIVALPAISFAQDNPAFNPPMDNPGLNDGLIHQNRDRLPPPSVGNPGLPPIASSSLNSGPIVMPIDAQGPRVDENGAPMPLSGNWPSNSTSTASTTRPNPRGRLPGVPPFGTSTSSTTRPGDDSMRAQINQRRNELRDLNNGSSTGQNGTSTDQQDGPHGDRKELRVDIFKLQQDNISRQLTRALDNLKQVRGRIQNRITKAEQSGINMSSAKALLVTADAKIAAANAAIINFQAYVPTGSSTIIATSTASTTASSTATTTNIRLDRPRQIGAAAIQAVKDAKNALSDVVVAIAHSTGLRLGDGNENATSTASTTISTSTATSTQ